MELLAEWPSFKGSWLGSSARDERDLIMELAGRAGVNTLHSTSVRLGGQAADE